MSWWYLWTKYIWLCGSSPSACFSLALCLLWPSYLCRVSYHHFSPTTQLNGYCQIRWAKLRSQHKRTIPLLPPSKPFQPLRNSLIYFLPMSGQQRLRNSLLYLKPSCPRLAHRLSMRSFEKRNLDIILRVEVTPPSFGRENHSYGRMNRDVYRGSWASVRSAVKRLEKSREYVSILCTRVYCLSIWQWFYAFSISPNTVTDGPQTRPPNATKNPFVEAAPRLLKRTLDVEGTGENYIFGNVQQPVKRSRIGKYLCHIKKLMNLITTIDKPKETQENHLQVINVDDVIPLRSVLWKLHIFASFTPGLAFHQWMPGED